MAESSEGSNNCSEQEIDAGKSSGTDRPRAAELLLLGEGPEGSAPPAHATRLLAWIASHEDTAIEEPVGPMDALFGLLYVLAVETGFTPLASADPFTATPRGDASAPNLRCVSRMPARWRRPGRSPRYVADFALGDDADLAARLMADPCGGALIVNMMSAEDPARAMYSTGLAPWNYFTVDGAPRNLRALSLRFKNAVTVPLRAAGLNARCVCNPSLPGLPAELHLQLAAQLPLPDLFHLGLTCSRLAPLLSDPALWRALVRRRYPSLYKELEARDQEQSGSNAEPTPVDWKYEYRKKRAQNRPLRGAYFRPAFFRPEFMM